MQKELIHRTSFYFDQAYNSMLEARQNWRMIFKSHTWSFQLVLTSVFIIPLYALLVPYLKFIELRHGVVLNDFFLNHVVSRDLSGIIFNIVYTSAAFILVYSLRSPWLMLRNMQIFLVLQYLRNLCLYLVPLAAPHGIIPLHDPVLEFIAYDQKPLLKDLFFSGHTATVVVFALLTKKNNYLFSVFVIISIIMAYLLMVQHCHYTIDIVGGAVFAVVSYYLVNLLWNQLNLNKYLEV